jgi:uroporphyrinogen-III synthase
MSDQPENRALAGRRIALPETRELDRLAQMLEEHGAETLRCPMVAINDAPDPAPVEAWLRRLPCDDLVLFTGEGVRRLQGFAQRCDSEPAFLEALSAARKITRGPKPERALRELGLKSDLRAAEPTTDGLIATLSVVDLRGRRVGVQLYPGNPNTRFIDFLQHAGAAPDPIVPYVYASAADDGRVIELIDRMAAGNIDVIAFTSSPQVGRLFDVAKRSQREAALQAGLRATTIAAVGPIVADEVRRCGFEVAITPEHSYFMKPLVSAIVAALSQ